MSVNQGGQQLKLEEWKKGDEITAEKLSQPVMALKSMRGARPPRQIAGKATAASVTVQRFKITAIYDDYLVCNPFTDPLADVPDTSQSVPVARPEALRASLASENGLTFTYTDEQSRTADDGSTTEAQVVVPTYYVDAIIYAMKSITGGTGLRLDNAEQTIVEWIDMNISGRAWAKDDTA